MLRRAFALAAVLSLVPSPGSASASSFGPPFEYASGAASCNRASSIAGTQLRPCAAGGDATEDGTALFSVDAVGAGPVDGDIHASFAARMQVAPMVGRSFVVRYVIDVRHAGASLAGALPTQYARISTTAYLAHELGDDRPQASRHEYLADASGILAPPSTDDQTVVLEIGLGDGVEEIDVSGTWYASVRFHGRADSAAVPTGRVALDLDARVRSVTFERVA